MYFFLEGPIFGSFHALARFFFVSRYRLNTFTIRFRHFCYYCDYKNVTRDAHELRLTLGRMQFSIHFYSSKFSVFIVAALVLFAEFELRFLIPRGPTTRKVI
jgi:hypothetical protein